MTDFPVAMMSNEQLKKVLVGEKLPDATLEEIFSMDEDELKFYKITKKQTYNIQLMKTIFQRLSTVNLINEEILNRPEKIAEWIRFNIGFNTKEEFFVIYLNSAGNVIKSEVLFVGCKNASVVGIDEVMRKAIMIKASAFAIAHNHPSGNIVPSFADKKLTKELKSAGELLDIKLLDHIIVSKENYFSFLKEGLL